MKNVQIRKTRNFEAPLNFTGSYKKKVYIFHSYTKKLLMRMTIQNNTLQNGKIKHILQVKTKFMIEWGNMTCFIELKYNICPFYKHLTQPEGKLLVPYYPYQIGKV